MATKNAFRDSSKAEYEDVFQKFSHSIFHVEVTFKNTNYLWTGVVSYLVQYDGLRNFLCYLQNFRSYNNKELKIGPMF